MAFRRGSEAAPGHYLMLLLPSGALRVECDSGISSLGAGSLFLAPPGSRPRLREGACPGLKAISFGPSLLDALGSGPSVDLVVGVLAAKEPLHARLGPEELQDALSLFPFLEREGASARRLPIIRLKVLELIILLGAEGEGAVPVPEAAKPRFKAAELMAYIEELYAESFSLDDLAARFGLNPSYLSRAFKAESGYTIVEFVNKVRIQKSCALLKRSNSSILDIAFAVGYNSLSHFNHYFRRLTGSSPSEFRSQSRK